MTDILSLPFDALYPEQGATADLRHARKQAQDIIAKSHLDASKLPDTLRELLTQIIRPLFTSTPNPNLTPSGRKLLVPQPPSLPNSGLASDHLAPHPWQNPLTIPLLTAILHTYPNLPDPTRKPTFDDHFYLLVPPILNVIDHHLSSSKISGYHLLRLLCEASVSADSTILKRSGLTDVFVDSLKTNSMMLPSLTPEEESLAVLRELYPAFHALLRARFVELPEVTKETRFETSAEIELRGKYLMLLLRHAVLSGLEHLGAGRSTSHVELKMFLVEQLRVTIEEMGVYAVRDLNVIVPMMRGLLMDPFGTAAPELLVQALRVLEVVLKVGAERVRDKWWEEVLRGVVGCWCNLLDEEEGLDGAAPRKGKGEKNFYEVKTTLKDITKVLGRIVRKDEWQTTKQQLTEEEEALEDLFEGT